MPRPGGNPVQEFMSRKFLMSMIALCTVCYMALVTKDPMWGTSIIGILAQYGYFNYVESKNVTKPMVETGDDLIRKPDQEPIEPAAQ